MRKWHLILYGCIVAGSSPALVFTGKLLGVTALKSCSGNKLALLPLDEGSNPSGAANIVISIAGGKLKLFREHTEATCACLLITVYKYTQVAKLVDAKLKRF